MGYNVYEDSGYMKKVELHVHLDGSVRVSTVSELLNLDVNYALDNMVVKDVNPDLASYLTKFDLPIKVMQTKENLKRIACELAQDLKLDDVIYAEVRFAPQKHVLKGLSLDEVVDAVLAGFKAVSGIKINVILCMMRGDSFDKNKEVIYLCKRYLDKGVVGLDLAGDEKNYKTKDYKALFDIANKENIPFTIHAGEADGAKSVLDAICFGAKRIGHGIRVLEDEAVLKKVIDNNVTLEVCPTSNVQTKAVNSYKEHPVKKLYDKNVLVTINTDNNTVSNLTLSKEYVRLRKYFNFTDADFLRFNINAVNASFISEEEKEKYVKIIRESYDESIRS